MGLKTLVIASVTVMVTSMSLSVAFAEGRARHDKRQGRQGARIHHGVKSGQLTAEEAAKLKAGQRHVRRVENKVEADGNVTAREKARLEKAQDRQSRRIHAQKHDGDVRSDAQAPAAAPAAPVAPVTPSAPEVTE